MLYQEMKIVDGKMVVVSSKKIDQIKLTSDCWLIQFEGLAACKRCEVAGTKECGGKAIRKRLTKTCKTCGYFGFNNYECFSQDKDCLR